VTMKRRVFLGWLPLLFLTPGAICSPPHPNFSGIWKQSNERSAPVRTGDVTLRIDHRDPEMTLETIIVRGSGESRRALQHYTTDGKASVSTGADGDEFHTAVVWNGSRLAFSLEEHEDGRIILSRETWTLIGNGDMIERCRERSGEKQIIVYLREAPKT
jgi:hypothetical protein